MENLNAEQVKKAYEHCITKVNCKGCPCWCEDKKCTRREDTLALITSQEQRIKELTAEIEVLKADRDNYKEWYFKAVGEVKQLTEDYKSLDMELRTANTDLHATRTELTRVQEDNERLRAENEALAISEVKECEISQMLVYRIRDKHPAVMAVISDTVRKMQERLKAKAEPMPMYSHLKIVYTSDIDQIAKEMLEGA